MTWQEALEGQEEQSSYRHVPSAAWNDLCLSTCKSYNCGEVFVLAHAMDFESLFMDYIFSKISYSNV